METLMLARYILEMSLMEYDLLEERDSAMAAAALLLAFKMTKRSSSGTLIQAYTGYAEKDLLVLMRKLNDVISASPDRKLMKTRTKYSRR